MNTRILARALFGGIFTCTLGGCVPPGYHYGSWSLTDPLQAFRVYPNGDTDPRWQSISAPAPQQIVDAASFECPADSLPDPEHMHMCVTKYEPTKPALAATPITGSTVAPSSENAPAVIAPTLPSDRASRADLHASDHTPGGIPVESDAIFAFVTAESPILDEAAQMVRENGYRCDSISGFRPFIFGNGYMLTCNGFRYEYDLTDKGGNWVVSVE